MTMSKSILDREWDKFKEVENETVVKVTEISGFSIPPESDSFTVSYPNSTTEVFNFRVGGVSGSIVKTLTLAYTNASKKDLVSGVWS